MISVSFFERGVCLISIKSDLVISFIEQLPEGAKVSVRELSAQLNVSEGTAYKAVKEAEQRGLVLVKPKAGTVRVKSERSVLDQMIPAADLCSLLGLTVHAGKEHLRHGIRKLVICNGSVQDLLRQLGGTPAEACLCLCGDRPDIQDAVLSTGGHLLLTDGARPTWTQISQAERGGLIILSSAQSAYSLVRAFDAEFAEHTDYSDSDQVSGWMQTPDYLYYNDIVADWQQFYAEGSFIKQYPLVDDNLELYGGLDLWRASAAVPSQKLRSAAADEMQIPTVSLTDDLKAVAKRFVVNGETLAAVMDGKRMVGTITPNDLLRYYMITEPNSYESAAESFLEKDNTVSDENTVIYRIRIPESEMKNIAHIEMDILLCAADNHLRQIGKASFKLDSGTFFATKKIRSSESLLLISKLQQTAGSTYVIETEINDDTTSYAKAVLVASVPDGKEE